VVERKKITIVECARRMLKRENLSNTLWVEAVSTAMYVQNRIPTKILEHNFFYEAFSGYKHVVNHLSIIGSKEISHIPNEDRRKLDARSVNIYFFIGYCVDHKAYKMYDHITHKLFAGRDVIFHEYAYDDDGQDVWKLPEECNGSARVEESEESNERSTRRKSGATRPRSEALRRSTRKI
jgi:hypothetical protein